MRGTAYGFIVCLAMRSISPAQNAFEDAVKQINYDNVKGYLQPFANSVGANINSGLFNTADIGEMGLSLQIQLVATGTMIGDAEKTFYALPPSQFPQSPVKTWTAESLRMLRVRSTLPRKGGYADHSSATAPATCGVAIEVPLKNE